MIRICGWCKTVQGEIAPLNDMSETHGICPTCEVKMMAEIRTMATELQVTA